MSAHFWPEFAILYVAALIGIACVTPYALELTAEAFAKAQERMRQPKWVLVLIQNAQSAVLMGVATGLGLLLAQRVGLGVPLLEGLLDGKDVTAQALAMIPPALLLGIGSSVVLLVLEITLFWRRVCLRPCARAFLFRRCGNASWPQSTAAWTKRSCVACSSSRYWRGSLALSGTCPMARPARGRALRPARRASPGGTSLAAHAAVTTCPSPSPGER